MIKVGTSMRQNISDARQAAGEAVREAISQLAGQKPDIIFMFSSIQYDQEELMAGARVAAAGAPIVGGSAAGEIIAWQSHYDAVGVMAITSDKIKFSVGCGRGVAKDSFAAAAGAAAAVIAANGGQKPDLFIMFPDGMTGNGAAIVEGARSVLGENFPIIGGSTGDDYQFKKTFEYCHGELLTDSIVGIGLSGNFSYGFGVRHGWEPVGLPLQVTKADGVVLKEINHEPALKVYQDYFGKNASDLIKEPLAKMAYTYPLGISVPESDELLLRDPVIANEKGEIKMAAAIPEGTVIRLMIGDRDAAIRAASIAARNALEELQGKKAGFVIMFNCMARNKLLGVRCNEENQTVQNALGGNIPMIGLYTYGEQGPLLGRKDTPAYFHNETMTMLVVGD